jgi:hypothetical protein
MNMDKFHHRVMAGIALAAASALTKTAGAQVVVSPANMNGWTLNSFDDNGTIVNSGPYYGTAAMAYGPGTPPLGVGSAHLATPVGAGDGAAAIATEQFDGTLLSSVTALSYYAYDVTNNGEQFPYLALSINTGAVDTTGNGNQNTLDTLFFEPPYQEPSTGNPLLLDQGATAQNIWQYWNAYVGGWWDNNNNGTPGTAEGPGTPGVQPLSTFLEDYPDAYIANGGLPGLGGIALQVGFGSSGETEDGYVDAFTIGVAGVNTTYNFEPNAVPEPASFSLIGLSAALLMRRRRRS